MVPAHHWRALIVLGATQFLMVLDWGWVRPRNSPFTIAGFSLTLYVISAGLLLPGVLPAGSGTGRRPGVIR